MKRIVLMMLLGIFCLNNDVCFAVRAMGLGNNQTDSFNDEDENDGDGNYDSRGSRRIVRFDFVDKINGLRKIIQSDEASHETKRAAQNALDQLLESHDGNGLRNIINKFSGTKLPFPKLSKFTDGQETLLPAWQQGANIGKYMALIALAKTVDSCNKGLDEQLIPFWSRVFGSIGGWFSSWMRWFGLATPLSSTEVNRWSMRLESYSNTISGLGATFGGDTDAMKAMNMRASATRAYGEEAEADAQPIDEKKDISPLLCTTRASIGTLFSEIKKYRNAYKFRIQRSVAPAKKSLPDDQLKPEEQRELSVEQALSVDGVSLSTQLPSNDEKILQSLERVLFKIAGLVECVLISLEESSGKLDRTASAYIEAYCATIESEFAELRIILNPYEDQPRQSSSYSSSYSRRGGALGGGYGGMGGGYGAGVGGGRY